MVLSVKITKIFSVSVLTVFILFLGSAVYPLQIKSHIWVSYQAIRIVEEKYPQYKGVLEQYRSEIIQGVVDCDLKPVHVPPTISTTHFQDPWLHVGIKDLSAGQTCQLLVDKALKLAKEKKISECFSEFGRAWHMLEDPAGVPFHANPALMQDGKMIAKHNQYEKLTGDLTEKEGDKYLVKTIFDASDVRSFYTDGLTHCDLSNAAGWVDFVAHKSSIYFDRVATGNVDEYRAVSSELLSSNQEVSAAFLLWFLKQIDLSEQLKELIILTILSEDCQVGDLVYYFNGFQKRKLIGEGRVESMLEQYGRPELKKATIAVIWHTDELVFEKDIIKQELDLFLAGYYITRKPENPYKQ